MGVLYVAIDCGGILVLFSQCLAGRWPEWYLVLPHTHTHTHTQTDHHPPIEYCCCVMLDRSVSIEPESTRLIVNFPVWGKWFDYDYVYCVYCVIFIYPINFPVWGKWFDYDYVYCVCIVLYSYTRQYLPLPFAFFWGNNISLRCVTNVKLIA